MINFLTFSSFLTLLACGALGVLYAWLLYRKADNLEKKLRIGLAILRAIVVAVLAWLLFAPLVKVVSYTPEKPIIVIANDNSISTAHVKPKGFDQQKYQQDLTELKNKLSAKYEVKTYSFSDSIRNGFDFSGKGKLTNAAALFQQLNDELINRNVGAVILASDGIFNRGGNPLYEQNKINAPIYTIALGDTIPKNDVLVANINYNNLVYLDNEFLLDIQVQAFESKNNKVKLTVHENGKQLAEQTLEINSQSFVKDIPIKLKANKVGIQQYKISVSALPNEITTVNNTQNIFVEVIDGRQKVLIAAAAPHPDLATLKQAIEENKHYEVEVLMGDELNNVQLEKYSLAIFYQLPSAVTVNAASLSKLQQGKTALWYIVGAQTNIQALHKIQKNIALSSNGNSLQEVFAIPSNNFTNFNVAQNNLKQLNDYDPLQMPYGNLQINGSYSALLNQRIGKISTQMPLWFFLVDDGKKMAFLVGEGIWKWKMEEAKDEKKVPLVNELINKTVQYLSVKDDKRKFRVYSSKNTFEENENVVLNAVLYNDAYEPVNNAEVRLQLKNATGKIYNFNFSKSGSAYLLDMGNLPQGNYTYQATTNLGDKKYMATGAFYINALIAEYQQTTANHQLLNTMASQSGGKMFMPAQILSIADELEKSGNVKTITYEDHRYDEWIDFKWIFILIILLLGIEWFLRKRNGEI